MAALSPSGLFIAGVGDSPAYVDFGAGFELVSHVKESHVLKEWLGSTDRPQPWTVMLRPEHEVRGVIITSDGVNPAAVTSLAADRSASDLSSALAATPSLGGDDASAAIAVSARTTSVPPDPESIEQKGMSA